MEWRREVTRWELWTSRGSSSRISRWVRLCRARLDVRYHLFGGDKPVDGEFSFFVGCEK